mmetsp:Transcript_122113/g.171877  ORF Transcript_122113/g.171877 Transcript_122113/m.171877 type:complete len:99 (+) Transcript_122113:201-497(+)
MVPELRGQPERRRGVPQSPERGGQAAAGRREDAGRNAGLGRKSAPNFPVDSVLLYLVLEALLLMLQVSWLSLVWPRLVDPGILDAARLADFERLSQAQ